MKKHLCTCLTSPSTSFQGVASNQKPKLSYSIFCLRHSTMTKDLPPWMKRQWLVSWEIDNSERKKSVLLLREPTLSHIITHDMSVIVFLAISEKISRFSLLKPELATNRPRSRSTSLSGATSLRKVPRGICSSGRSKEPHRHCGCPMLDRGQTKCIDMFNKIWCWMAFTPPVEKENHHQMHPPITCNPESPK